MLILTDKYTLFSMIKNAPIALLSINSDFFLQVWHDNTGFLSKNGRKIYFCFINAQ